MQPQINNSGCVKVSKVSCSEIIHQYPEWNQLSNININEGAYWWQVYSFDIYFFISSDKGLLPDWRHAMTWTIAESLSFDESGTYFSEVAIKTQRFFCK